MFIKGNCAIYIDKKIQVYKKVLYHLFCYLYSEGSTDQSYREVPLQKKTLHLANKILKWKTYEEMFSLVSYYYRSPLSVPSNEHLLCLFILSARTYVKRSGSM